MEKSLFRKKAMERISSPEQLTDYLHVTTPSIWILLSAVVLFLIGMIAWSCVGTLETRVDAKAVINGGKAEIVVTDADSSGISAGMPVHIASQEYIVSSVSEDDYGRNIAYAEVSLPDGTYDADIVIEQIHPIKFLLESR